MRKSFIEVFKVQDGVFCNIALALERMRTTCIDFYGHPLDFDLGEHLVEKAFQQGLVKVRVEYSDKIEKVELSAYTFRKIESMVLVQAPNIKYEYKYADRSEINALNQQKGVSDEILIERNGAITDTSYSNVVLEDATGFYTPSTYLLNGTKRRQLLAKGIIRERHITIDDLNQYQTIYLINAMIDLEDRLCLNTDRIVRFANFEENSA